MGVKTRKKTKNTLAPKRNWLMTLLRLAGKIALWFVITTVFLVIIFKWVPVPATPLMAVRCLEQRSRGEKMVCEHDWVPIEKISKNMQRAVIASEDATFMTHSGFDIVAIQKAMKSNAKGKKLRGGSTISQQTAKNVFLWQGRSYVRKALEAYFTVLIELIWGKERIMEVYLNSIEMGDGIYGVQAASQHWYRKDAENLTRREAAGIAAILPNPLKFKAAGSSSFIERRKSRIIKHMRYVGSLDY